MEKQIIEISTQSIVKTILIVLAFVFLYFIRDVLIIVLFAIVIASVVDGPVKHLKKHRIPRVAAVLLTYLGAFIVLGIFIYLVTPPLISEIRQFSEIISDYERGVSYLFGNLDLPLNISSLIDNLTSNISQATSGIIMFTTRFFGGVFSAVSILVLSFYLSIQENGVEKFLRLAIPKKHEEYIIDLWEKTNKKIGRWAQGQLLLAIIVGSMSFISLSLLGVKYALALSIIAGLLEMLPIIGPIIATIPAFFFASFQDPVLGLIVLGVYIVIQQVENQLFVPLIMKKAVGLNPVIVIVAILIGAKLGGIAGMILAIPLSVTFMEFWRDFMARRREAIEV